MKVIVEQGDILDALMAVIDPKAGDAKTILCKLVRESEPAGGTIGPNRYGPPLRPEDQRDPIISSIPSGEGRPTKPPAQGESPLEARVNELRDDHGPVFVIGPLAGPAGIGQTITHGNPPRPVEVLEAVTQADASGKIVPGRYFVKLAEG